MPFPPSGSIYLIGGVLIDNTYQHTLSFDNQVDQLNYFQDLSRARIIDTDYSFVRKDGTLKFKRNFDDLWDVNYLLYQNNTGKWIFSFITDKVYVNDNMTEIFFETDVYQTYLFDHSFTYSHVEREHQDRWSAPFQPNLNYVEEGLAYGDEYVKQHEEVYRDGSDQNIAWFLIVTSERLESIPVLPAEVMQGTPSPLYYYLTFIDRRNPTGGLYDYQDSSGNALLDAQKFSQLIADRPEILSVSYIPYLPFVVSVVENGLDITVSPTGGEFTPQQVTTTGTIYFILRLDGGAIDPFTDSPIGTFRRFNGKALPGGFGVGQQRDFTKESKLLTFPYTYNLLTDGQANPLMIKNEYVESDIEFVYVAQSLNINPKTKYYIEDYRGESNGKTYNITNTSVNDLPLLTDAYKSYLAQNRATASTGIGLNLLSGVASLGIGVASGGVAAPLLAGEAIRGFSAVAGELAKRKDLQSTPDNLRQAGNNIAFSFVDDSIDLRHQRFEITLQYKQILADFFAKYGYKCNELKIPNLKTRYYYNYIKCYEANLNGDIDMDDLRRLKKIYEDGVTIWHKRPGNILNPVNDYNWDNVEMSLL